VSLQQLLSRCDGALAGVIMGRGGAVIEALEKSGGLDVRGLGVDLAAVVDQVRNAAAILEVGGLEELTMRSETLLFIVLVLNQHCFLGLALRPDSRFGQGRVFMRLALSDIQSKL
jgi:predicted regulator of Ras-like GTPase activity (Roadblock/LC7/MglB family)